MSDFFPKWANRLPRQIAVGGILAASLVTAGIWYYFTPKYTRVGYQPIQPVPYSHAVHVGQLGLDCRYCHTGVERSWYANVPSSSVCMNCHKQVLPNDPRLELVRNSAKSGEPIGWVQIHLTPDFVYFNHAVHVNRGVSCVSCHGQINELTEVREEKSLAMFFCLECHRNPAPNLRPLNQVYNLAWSIDPQMQQDMGTRFVHDWKINSPQYCSTCHR
ncbi:MAG: cytochrome c family protein [Candidatus Omnitrophica bacterium]|nr:cytochrome c family protein [Candidatus Omnitrophota bacterium]